MVTIARLAALILLGASLVLLPVADGEALEQQTASAATRSGTASANSAQALVTTASASTDPARTKARQAKPRKSAGRKSQPVVQPTKAASVYLMRGFLGIFSLGMDRLNDQLKAAGVKTKIIGHTRWPGVVSEIAAEQALHPGQHAPVVIIGHSLGANAALLAGYELGKQGIPVDLVVTVDPTSSRPISPVVKRYLNIYLPGDGFGAKLAATGSGVDNDDIRANPELNRPGVNHFTMDEHPVVLKQIFDATMPIVKPGARKGAGKGRKG
ncbi:hypothetical protein OSH08_16435 [Kaistia geumhonensis]|uniref:Thioesterase domain-containing protein n=1 Tax=Kaistia geumhonensis TaxID=410839 RepID=A0ABU0M9R4_9HYPH|nr:hypothetical protein [Kaistia geumhonensis]MCX5480592.1 hypothetical protein [Kaistia geumhonensis]MDQ0517706.1 hypothetical protein [Kaistia geumhonensis]